jgi:hypothetical protein
MTMHEALNFLDLLHNHIEHSVSNPGPWCWPTRQLVHYNLGLNRSCFPRDKRVYDSFNRQFKIARSRHWTDVGPCASHCHAEHLRLTDLGAEALRVMNEQGCGAHCHQHRETKLHLQRKVA